MNLETKIDKRLWRSIRSSHESRNFTGAIQDSIYYLSELIRERSGLDGDGASLIGQAFGGRNPLLKVNSLKTESDKNTQKGLEQLLRGLYSAIRNPRSHEKFSDTEDDAIAIILFVNFIIGVIDKSRPPFSESAFVARVLDKDFVPSERYANLLVGEIPKKKLLDVFYQVFGQIDFADQKKLQYFFNALMTKTSLEERADIYREVSDLLKTSNRRQSLRVALHAFSDHWENFDESARLRVENMLIRDIRGGLFDQETETLKSGAFGTWVRSIRKQLTLKDELNSTLIDKLYSPDREEQDYVFNYFSSTFPAICDEPSSLLKRRVKSGLRDGDVRFKALVDYHFMWAGETWLEPFKESLAAFQEESPSSEEDEIPF